MERKKNENMRMGSDENYMITVSRLNYHPLIAFNVRRTLPNTDLSRDFMGLLVDGSMDLGTHIWHPPQIFLQGRMTSQRQRAWYRDLPKDKEPGDIERTL